MSTRSQLGNRSTWSRTLQARKQKTQERGYLARSLRSLLIESLEDRRVMAGDLALDQLLLSGSVVDNAPMSEQLVEAVQDIPEVLNWQAEIQAINAANQLDVPSAQQNVEQTLAQHAEAAISSLTTPGAITDELSFQPVSLGTLSVAQAISQSIASTNWQAQLSSVAAQSAVDMSQSISGAQPSGNQLDLTQQQFDSQAITQAMAQAVSPGQLIGGQLVAAADTTGLSQSLRQAESEIMVSGGQQWNSNLPTAQPASTQSPASSINLGLDVQGMPLSDSQVAQAVDGSLIAGLFGASSSQEASQSASGQTSGVVLAEGEGDSSGSGSSSASSAPAPPHVDFPQLRFAIGGGDPGSFVPGDLTSFTDAHGSPGSWSPGSNWTHTVTVNKTSDQVWSYTEQLSMIFLVTESTNDGGPLSFLDLGDSNNLDSRLQLQGNWSSHINTLRLGYVNLTFHASRGQTGATANSALFNMGGGTRWSISLNFLDAVQTIANASAGSTALINPALINSTASSDPNQLPNDFTGSSNWSANFMSVQSVMGTLSISSIPFWLNPGAAPAASIVDRLISANGSTSTGRSFQETENFRSASQSGNLARQPGGPVIQPETAPNNPLPRGGREEVDFGAEVEAKNTEFGAMNPPTPPGSSASNPSTPDDPGQGLTGHGSASAASSSRSSSGLATQTGTWNVFGVFREMLGQSRWMGAFGNAASEAESELNSQGRADGRIVVIPVDEVQPNPLIGGTTTYSGMVIAGANVNGSGSGTASFAATAVITNDTSGQLVLEPDDDGQAEIHSDVQSGGKDFYTLVAKSVDSGVIENWGLDNGGQYSRLAWHPNEDKDTLVYHTEAAGTSEGTAFSSVVNGNAPVAGTTLKWNGSGVSKLHTTNREKFDTFQAPPAVAHLLSFLTESSETLEVRYTENVDLTGELQNDVPVWTGSAVRDVKGNLKYAANRDDSWFVGDYINRTASFDRQASFTSSFNPSTQLVTESGSVSGDPEVTVSGGHELELGENVATYDRDDRSTYELSLEAIFNDWDGSLVIPPPPTQPPPSPTTPPPGTGNPPPASSESMWDGFARWFGGSNGDAVDTALGYLGFVAEGAKIVGSIVAEPLDWYLSAEEIYNDPGNIFSYAGLIPFIPTAAGKGLKEATQHADEAASAAAKLVPGNGTTVLGSYPHYIDLADKLNATRFSIPTSVWEKMTDIERWAANTKFLDRLIARGDVIVLSNSGLLARAGTSFHKEIQYLISKGFRLSEDGLRMLPPGS